MQQKSFSKNFFLIILSIINLSISAQEKNLLGLEKFSEVNLVLRDGRTLVGLGKFNIDRLYVFKLEENSKKQFFDEKKIKEIIYHYGKAFEYKIVEYNSYAKVQLLEVVVSGKLKLYRQDYSARYQSGLGNFGVPALNSFGQSYNYYISRNDEDIVSKIKHVRIKSKKFKRFAKSYFSDCKDLVLKIESNYFENLGIIKIVSFYNENCSDKE